MPFRKSSRRNYKRSKLTKSNILANRSAKSQSKQIAALSRKVNILAKANKPEFRSIWIKYNHEFTNSSLNSNWYGMGLHPWLSSYAGDDQGGSGAMNLEGNYCRSKGLAVKLVSQYNEFQNAEIGTSTITATEPRDICAGYRIVIIQEKQATTPGESSQLYSSSIFSTDSSTSSDEYNLTCPMIPGVTTKYKILYCKSFTVNTYRPTRYHNIYIPAKRMLNFTKQIKPDGTESSTCKGKIWVCVFTAGLHYDMTYGSKIILKGSAKLAFTDN